MNKTKEFVVYKITNTINGLCYIGITTNYKKRIQAHFYCYGNHRYLHNSIQKYGKEKFKHEIIFECNSWEELCKKEIEYIGIFNTKTPNGYNMTDGGDGTVGCSPSKETRKKMSEAHKNPSDETRKKMSNSAKGRKFSLEARKKMSNSAKGKIMSTEARKKMSDWQMGKKMSKETRKKLSDAQQNMPKEIKQKISELQRAFSKNQILEIRKMLLSGISQYRIADKFNVHQSTISYIKTNKQYADIQLP